MPSESVKLCECGCGQSAPIAKQTETKYGYVKGQPKRYIRGHRTMLRVVWLPEDRGYETPCHIWQGACDGSGYGQGLKRGGATRVKAHRQAWIEANGPIPDGLCVLHRCDQPPCINVDHLFVGTLADNTRDMMAKRRHWVPSGEIHSRAKITNGQAAEIRAAKGISNADLGRRYSIDPSTISRIRSGERWKNLDV